MIATNAKAPHPDEKPHANSSPLVKFPPPIIFGLSLLLGLFINQLYPLKISGFWIRSTIGLLFLCTGILLLATATISFRNSGQDLRPWTPSPSLITHGPYRFTRNPMYLGMALIQAGIGCLFDNLWIFFLTGISILIVQRLVIYPEEKYLLETFGESYVSLLRSTRRWF
ncbi:MAG: isoprenylcysteine carboxylmethyltransferase family protein [Myxococcales bacterium]|nr:isoprenylcysteine carboxylmethyltransferase family protein [Myxococcales bacterium]